MLNSTATKFIKSWLGLTCSTTVAVIYHPAVLDIPSLAAQNTPAKLTYLASVYLTPDPLLQEISSVALTVNFMEVNRFPSETKSIISQAKESLEYITGKTLS